MHIIVDAGGYVRMQRRQDSHPGLHIDETAWRAAKPHHPWHVAGVAVRAWADSFTWKPKPKPKPDEPAYSIKPTDSYQLKPSWAVVRWIKSAWRTLTWPS